MSTITIGVDLAKSNFSVCVVDAAGHVRRRRDLGREAFALWLALDPATGVPDAVRQSAGGHRQQARAATVGNAGAR